MVKTDKTRPISGEIMESPAPERIARAREDDVVEAEYESLGPASVPAPVSSTAGAPPVRGMEMLRGMGGHVARATRGGPVFWSLGLAMVATAFWISGGHVLLASHGETRKITGAQRLTIENVASRVEGHGERIILHVDGEAFNRGHTGMAVPPIAIAITDGAGETTRHFLGTNGMHLVPGESFGFSSRVEAPSNGVKSVTVTFREE
jgi:hypothetical protein